MIWQARILRNLSRSPVRRHLIKSSPTALDPIGADISLGLRLFVTDSAFFDELILVLGIVTELESQCVS